MEDRVENVEVGAAIVFVDSVGKSLPALVTANWGGGCINFVFVSGDKERQDDYGRQIDRQTSMSHVSDMNVHGFYWKFADEESNPYTPPKAT